MTLSYIAEGCTLKMPTNLSRQRLKSACRQTLLTSQGKNDSREAMIVGCQAESNAFFISKKVVARTFRSSKADSTRVTRSWAADPISTYII
jgi:hypothetical protein